MQRRMITSNSFAIEGSGRGLVAPCHLSEFLQISVQNFPKSLSPCIESTPLRTIEDYKATNLCHVSNVVKDQEILCKCDEIKFSKPTKKKRNINLRNSKALTFTNGDNMKLKESITSVEYHRKIS